MQNPQEHINIFIAYSRKDRTYLDGLRTHLKPLERNEKLNIWDDGEITPGAEWEREIKRHINSAHIILLFISADSLSSEYFYGKEMKSALKRHQSGKATVIPVILRPCLWNKETSLGELQALPKDGKPLSTWNDIESGYTNIANGVDKSINDIKNKRETIQQQIKEAEKRRIENQRKLEAQKIAEEERKRQKIAETKRRLQEILEQGHQREIDKKKKQEEIERQRKLEIQKQAAAEKRIMELRKEHNRAKSQKKLHIIFNTFSFFLCCVTTYYAATEDDGAALDRLPFAFEYAIYLIVFFALTLFITWALRFGWGVPENNNSFISSPTFFFFLSSLIMLILMIKNIITISLW